MSDSSGFQSLLASVLNGSLDIGPLIGSAERVARSGGAQDSIALYRVWLLANPEHPLRHIIAFNCGSAMLQAGDLSGARKYLQLAVEVNPDFFQAYLNLAAVYERASEGEAAMLAWQQVIDRLSPVNGLNIGLKIQAFKNIARVKRSSEAAEVALRQAIEIDATQADVVQHWINRRQGRCVWPLLEPVGNLTVRDVLERMAPLSIAAFADDPMLQLAVARAYTVQMAGKARGIGVVGSWPVPSRRPEKLRIGYLSSDFCHHAVGYLMSDVFENHDRTRYEITVFNIGERSEDAIQKRIMGDVDHWCDIRGVPDKSAAQQVMARDIDILIDMNGHTNFQRTGLLAMKPAPIIANWLGYPGTMGSTDHHYIIADDFLIPESFERFYSEKVLRLPCYQPNGKLYPVPELQTTRAELGLPETGVVFCCFNGSVKITEPVFARWCVILASVPGSVIWLRGSPEDDFAHRLRAEAARRGIAPDRLVFLPFRSNTEYLGCHRHADLFLDTFPYGAHTTASDALRMGVPIVTLAGLSFASRVCGSLSRAAGLPDLVCHTPDDYVSQAIALGNDPARLAAMKQKLLAALPGCDLFNAPKLVGHLEGLFEAMWSDYANGSQPNPDSSWLSFDQCIPPEATRVNSDWMPFAEYERRRRLHPANQ